MKRFAYADPPYLGRGEYYRAHHADAMQWNDPEAHRRLIAKLVDEYPDGWVMSISEDSLRTILPMCPSDARVGSWLTASPRYAGNSNPVLKHFEPVIFVGGRSFSETGTRSKDYLITSPQRLPAGNRAFKMDKGAIRGGKIFLGQKPRAFCDWVITLLGARTGDQFDDLFPGTGAFTHAWQEFCQRYEQKTLILGTSE